MKILALGLLALSLISCSANVSGPGDIPAVATKQTAFEHKLQGPNLDGEWQSSCVADKWSVNYVSFNIKIVGQDIARVITSFSDRSCAHQIKVDKQLGLFRYVKKHNSEIYEIEYQLKFDGGHYYTGENIQIKDLNHVLISDRIIGDQVRPDISLQRVGSAPLFSDTEISYQN